MRTRLVLTPLLLVLIAACGGGSSPAAGGSTSGGQASTASPTAQATGGAGTVDCAKIKSAGAQLLAVQLLAQLKTPETIASIKSKEFGNLDLDAFLAAMHDLHALDGVSSPLGDPKASIDFYEKAANAAKVLFATEPMTQAAIDTYNENVGSLVDFLGHQAPISAAMDAVGC